MRSPSDQAEQGNQPAPGLERTAAAVAVLFSLEGVAVASADREVLAGADLAIPEGGCTVLVAFRVGETVQLGRADARAARRSSAQTPA